MSELGFPVDFRKLEPKFSVKIVGERMDSTAEFGFEFSKMDWEIEF